MEQALALPAYEQVLKAAHSFNLLDARGAISVTERAAYIGRIRNLASSVAQSYYESRERLGFPMAPREWVAQMQKKAEGRRWTTRWRDCSWRNCRPRRLTSWGRRSRARCWSNSRRKASSATSRRSRPSLRRGGWPRTSLQWRRARRTSPYRRS